MANFAKSGPTGSGCSPPSNKELHGWTNTNAVADADAVAGIADADAPLHEKRLSIFCLRAPRFKRFRKKIFAT